MFEELEKVYETMMGDLKIKAEATIMSALQKVFEGDNPPYCISWTQYAPYFNDGDECVFGVNDIEVFLTEEDFDEYDYSDRDNPVVGELYNFSRSELGEQIFKSVFGNHSKVVVTKDGFEVEEYDHD